MKRSTKACGLLCLLVISGQALCEARSPHPVGLSATARAAPSSGRSSAQLRVGLTLVSAGESQAEPPSPAELDYPASPSALMCRSEAGAYRECRTPFRGRVVLSRELDGTRCIEGSNWGWREGAVWVDQGCAAVFLRESVAVAGSSV